MTGGEADAGAEGLPLRGRWLLAHDPEERLLVELFANLQKVGANLRILHTISGKFQQNSINVESL